MSCELWYLVALTCFSVSYSEQPRPGEHGGFARIVSGAFHACVHCEKQIRNIRFLCIFDDCAYSMNVLETIRQFSISWNFEWQLWRGTQRDRCEITPQWFSEGWLRGTTLINCCLRKNGHLNHVFTMPSWSKTRLVESERLSRQIAYASRITHFGIIKKRLPRGAQ